MRAEQTATAWQCPKCHEHVDTPMPTLGVAHYCPRSLKVENFVPAWATQRAAERDTKAVRTLKAVA